ncbi:MAG TPA: LysE family translocator [Kribbellaceae bacterium]|nr:LysE family translocator [Kribbellaceae bacterium]
MPSTSHVPAFMVAALVIIVIPGPSVLFTVGRALSYGRREALLTVLGNGLGATVVAAAVAVGLGAVIAASAVVLTVIKLAGASYLIYLGVRAFRERRSLAQALAVRPEPARSKRVLRQGFMVGLTNPKTAVFFAAVLPQFTDPAAGPLAVQTLVFAAIFLPLAIISDSTWALLAGAARSWFARSPRRLELVGGTGGLMIIGLGATVAVTGTAE